MTGTLPAARRTLANAIAALVDPRPHTIDGRVEWVGSVYAELLDAIHGHRSGSTRQPSEPQPPLWIDGLDLVTDIDTTVLGWERCGVGPQHVTINRLRRIAERKWRPQDVPQIDDMSGRLQQWVKRYTALTEPRAWHLPAACPECGKRTVYRESAGEEVRQPALQLTTAGCVCQACRAYWPPTRFAHLALVLGYQLPPELSDA